MKIVNLFAIKKRIVTTWLSSTVNMYKLSFESLGNVTKYCIISVYLFIYLFIFGTLFIVANN